MQQLLDSAHRMWISGTTQYALRAVLHVAEHGRDEPVRVDEIAAALNVPRNYLSKTLHALARAGVLRSGRGPRGGFQLADDAAALTLARVAAPFDDLAQRHCLLRQQACGERSACAAHTRWESISSSLTAFFGETTIEGLLRGRTMPGVERLSGEPADAQPHDRPAAPRSKKPSAIPPATRMKPAVVPAATTKTKPAKTRNRKKTLATGRKR